VSGHTVGVEPITADLRRAALPPAAATVAVVERMDGDLVKLCATDGELPGGILAKVAAGAAMAYGARLVPPRPTVTVVPISAHQRRLLTRHETGSHAIVLRQAGARTVVLGTGHDPARLSAAAAELALTYAAALVAHDSSRCWACCPPLVVVRGCLDCRAGVVPALAHTDGRLVAYWTHRTEPEHPHAARVGVA
jgi:hypothetical protein